MLKDRVGNVDLFNRRGFERSALLLAGSVQWTNIPSGERFQGLRQFLRNCATAFPDVRVEITNLVAAEDWVVAEFIGQGTHIGPFTGHAVRIPPTGQRMEMSFCEVFQIVARKIVNARLYFDLTTLIHQLGLSRSSPRL